MTEAELLVRQATGPQFDAVDDRLRQLERRIAALEATFDDLTRMPPPDDPVPPPTAESGCDQRVSD